MMTTQPRKWILLGCGALLVFALDRFTKLWVISALALYESVQPIPALAPYFQITRSYNTGAAFGFLAGTPLATNLFLAFAVIITGGLLWSYRQVRPNQYVMQAAYALVIAGALGNALDRVVYGHVIDFIHYQLPGVISNVSNLADHAIVLGVGLLVIATWRADARQTSTEQEAP
ncbi:MAG: signal peptidase II [Phototrophicaceae bacterium]|jgi:signal peptidase II